MTGPAVDAIPNTAIFKTHYITHSTMDAAEDKDVKLQRASGDLVSEFSAKLPSLLWRAQTGTPLRTPRKWAQVTKTEKLVSLVRPHRIVLSLDYLSVLIY